MYTSNSIFCICMWYWKKGPPYTGWLQLGGIPLLPTFTFMTHYSISFIFVFKEHQNCLFKVSRKVKIHIFFPAPAMVTHTKGTFTKNNHNHSQTAGPRKNLTVTWTCSFMADKKIQFLSFFSESSPALNIFWLYAWSCIGKTKRSSWDHTSAYLPKTWNILVDGHRFFM